MGKREQAVLLAAAIYGLFSSPTPDAPGLAEYLILLLLAFAALPLKIVSEKWVVPFAVFLAYGLTVPFITGALHGNAGADMLRDVVAFGALALPLLLSDLYPLHDPRAQKHLLWMLIGIGLLFSLRYLVATLTAGDFWQGYDLLYLANSPLVAFAAIWLLLHGCFAENRPVQALVCAVLSAVPLVAMIGMMQRATVILLVLAWVVMFAMTLVKKPRRALIVTLVLAVTVMLLWPLPMYVYESFADKTMNVGWNARGAELAALMKTLNADPLTAMFGAGWGSVFKSPAVGDMWVRFSHALLTSLAWKTGWVGVTLGVIALGVLIISTVRRLRDDMVMVLSLILPLLPALFLYGSYKSLCFGLLLLGLARLTSQPWTKPGQGC